MPLPDIKEFTGTNITQRKFQEAQGKLLEFVDEIDQRQAATANGYYKSYATLAAANADIANIPLGVSVKVLSDEEGGEYYKAISGATSLTKSPYDPLTISKAAIEEKIIFEDGLDIAVLEDANGKSVYRIKKDGKIYIVGLGSDIASSINDLNSLMAVTDSENLIELHDINGNKTIIQNKKGELILPTIGNLTLALKDLAENSKNNELNLKNAHLSGKYADYVLTENMQNFEHTDYLLKASEVHAMGIFPHGVSLLRIPAITRIGKNKYLLFFEARQSWDDFGRNSQGVATVTVEETTGVASVSNVQCLHAAFTDSENKLRTFMNACAVKLDSGRIICLYVRRYGSTEHQLYKRYSDDDGVNWSEYEDITSVKGSTGWNVLCPCSQGLVKRHGQHKGRIIFPLWHSGTTYAQMQFRSGYIYSDDNGETWNLGEFADYASANEVQCAEDLNGDLLFSIRLENRNPPKVLARHSDLTKEYSGVKSNKALTNEIIMSGLIQGENQFDKTANKFQLTACNTTSRKELLIHTSYDGGENWITHLLPTTINQPVAYSCIENLSASKKFLLWEADNTVNLKYSVVALSNLINQGQ
ncbi:exo-alpha-sialidase [Acinetobacter indicus]|uniref:exo-alpha-sialidase n=1 Tax=Acinetobacter indicus TaxID=756892 RepID=UPI0009D66063|nr:sialidase family protein [Acinetobacter indicus]